MQLYFKIMKRFMILAALTVALLAAVQTPAKAQSKSFNLARWMQTQTALLQELNRS